MDRSGETHGLPYEGLAAAFRPLHFRIAVGPRHGCIAILRNEAIVSGIHERLTAPLGASTITALFVLALAAPSRLRAQPVTTATIGGTVKAPDGAELAAASVLVRNLATGYAVETEVVHGRYRVAGLEVGGPYTVRVRRIGYTSRERTGLYLTLGETVDLPFVLEAAPSILDTVRITQAGRPTSTLRQTKRGTGVLISDSALQRMPVLDRDALDFARLVPQVGTRFGGISGAGVGFRLNSYLIDGATERLVLGNGTVSSIANGKTISIDAVKQYEVVLAPYDPRYGDFAGALVNAVTKSGTNELHGTAFVYARNEAMARNTPFLRDAPYDRSQYGFTLGGPIVRDRIHFFVSTELQRFRQPALGPYFGDVAPSPTPPPVAEADAQRFESILRGDGLDAGSGGRLVRTNPNANIFGRIDVSLPALKSRAVLRQNYADASEVLFARTSVTSFSLTSNAWTQAITRSSTTAQIFTNFRDGGLNEFLVSRGSAPQRAAQLTVAPLVRVTVPRVGGANATLVGGPPENAQGTGTYQTVVELSDHVALPPLGAHTPSLGARAELFSVHATSTRRPFGVWQFLSLDSLARGEASSFLIEKDFGSATAPLRGSQLSAYASDEWQLADRMSVDLGLRADFLEYHSRPLYNPVVDSIFGRRTSDFPRPTLQWSPRLGFRWDVGPDGHDQLRAGAGVFVGRPPLAWVSQSLRFDGVGTRALNCTASTGGVPQFVADPLHPPTACTNGRGFSDGLVNLIDGQLKMAEMFRASVAYDRVLAWDVRSSLEVLYTRTLHDLYFANPNLSGPTGVDRHGRVLYGQIDASGKATPSRLSGSYVEMVDLRNHSNGHSLSATTRLEKQFGEQLEATVSYTRSRVRDVQTLTAPQGQTFNAWASGRTMFGMHEDLATGGSSYEIPNRLIFAGTWTAPWKRWATSLTLSYVGESGIPFAYIDSSASGLGDLNADGTSVNDPIYVPRSAADTSEIAFDGSPDDLRQQQIGFAQLIATTPCLRRQQGRIMARNSCQAPWVHSANASLRQAVPSSGLSVEVEVFNLLNLLDRRWGLFRVPRTVLLQHVGQTPGPAAQPIFHFDKDWAPYSSDNAESAYQIQLALRYRF